MTTPLENMRRNMAANFEPDVNCRYYQDYERMSGLPVARNHQDKLPAYLFYVCICQPPIDPKKSYYKPLWEEDPFLKVGISHYKFETRMSPIGYWTTPIFLYEFKEGANFKSVYIIEQQILEDISRDHLNYKPQLRAFGKNTEVFSMEALSSIMYWSDFTCRAWHHLAPEDWDGIIEFNNLEKDYKEYKEYKECQLII